MWQCSYAHIVLFLRVYVAPKGARVPFLKAKMENTINVFPSGFAHSAGNITLKNV